MSSVKCAEGWDIFLQWPGYTVTAALTFWGGLCEFLCIHGLVHPQNGEIPHCEPTAPVPRPQNSASQNPTPKPAPGHPLQKCMGVTRTSVDLMRLGPAQRMVRQSTIGLSPWPSPWRSEGLSPVPTYGLSCSNHPPILASSHPSRCMDHGTFIHAAHVVWHVSSYFGWDTPFSFDHTQSTFGSGCSIAPFFFGGGGPLVFFSLLLLCCMHLLLGFLTLAQVQYHPSSISHGPYGLHEAATSPQATLVSSPISPFPTRASTTSPGSQDHRCTTHMCCSPVQPQLIVHSPVLPLLCIVLCCFPRTARWCWRSAQLHGVAQAEKNQRVEVIVWRRMF